MIFGIIVAYVLDTTESVFSPLSFRTCTRLIYGHVQLHTPAALYGTEVGIPSAVERSSQAGPETGKWITETMQIFITFTNVLKLHLHAKDQLHAMLQELVTELVAT
ncbi:hypothetical protein EDD15DRAFT_2199303 [Pisolithus albus]|nr:hypothetical protein EDD15DRAFT_2199303 [Pisolithus albus]